MKKVVVMVTIAVLTISTLMGCGVSSVFFSEEDYKHDMTVLDEAAHRIPDVGKPPVEGSDYMLSDLTCNTPEGKTVLRDYRIMSQLYYDVAKKGAPSDEDASRIIALFDKMKTDMESFYEASLASGVDITEFTAEED